MAKKELEVLVKELSSRIVDVNTVFDDTHKSISEINDQIKSQAKILGICCMVFPNALI